MAMMMTTAAIIPSTTTKLSPSSATPRHSLIKPSNLTFNSSIHTTTRGASQVVHNAKGPSGMKEQKWVHEGLIVESLPNGMFRVKLDNEDVVLGYISGRIRKSFVRVLPGDRVRIEVSRYDSTRGRITYRLRTKDLNSSG
ncbi:hypothetical protein ACHQM5_002145 [Ranunculus cassubicifolius]